MLRHPFAVNVTSGNQTITVAKRSTSAKAESQAENIRRSFGTFGRNIPTVSVVDLSVPTAARPFRSADDAD